MPSVIVSKNSCKIEALYQWDVGQVLHIHGLTLPAAEVHFAHGTAGMAIVRTAEVGADGVISVGVPNVLLQEAKKINAYVCTYEGEAFQSLYRIEIPVIARAKPSDYAGEVESEVYSLEALGVEVITLAPGENATAEKVLNPDGSWTLRFSVPGGKDGKTPARGKDYWTPGDKEEIVSKVLEALPSGGAGGGTGKRAVSVIIGSAESGHTADDCDYLCTGALDETLSDALRAISLTGGEIRLLQGVYTLNGEAIVDTDGVTISGCGGGTVLRGTGSLWLGAASDFVVRDLTFDGCYITAFGEICEISRCRFIHNANYTATYGVLLKAPRVNVIGNYFENILVAVSIEENASSCIISGNTLVDCNDGICDVGGVNNIIHDNSIVETTTGKVNTAIYAIGSNAYITDNVINVSDADAFPTEPFVVQGENNVHVNNFVNGVLVDAPSGGVPDGGNEGDVLTKTATGTEWKSVEVETDSDIFFAEIGKSTFVEVKSAIDAGKHVVCRINARGVWFSYNLLSATPSEIVFDGTTTDGRFMPNILSTDNSWTAPVVNSAPSAHKKNHAKGGDDVLLPADIGAIPAPATAEVGQLLSVKAVDANGAPTEWEVMDAPAGGGETWRLIADIELTEEVNGVEITQDMDGKAIALKKFYVLLTSTVPTGTAFTTIKTVVNTHWGSPMGDFTRGFAISNNAQNNETTRVRYFYTYAEFIPDVGCLAWVGCSANLYNQSANMQQMLRGYVPLYQDSAINRLLVTPNDGGAVIGGVGSKVMIWGVDA